MQELHDYSLIWVKFSNEVLSPFKVVTYGDAVVIGVSNHLVLDLLPAFQRFVHQHLCRMGKR